MKEEAKQQINIVIASDHAGFDLKEKIKALIDTQNFRLIDCGTFSTESVDYPDYAKVAIAQILQNSAQYGILICKTGIGMSIYANRFRSIRAALCHNTEDAELARQHNDANVLVLAAKKLRAEEALKIIDSFLRSNFLSGRHLNRVNKLNITERDLC